MGQIYLLIGAVLAVGIGLAHSVLGERYILTRLFRKPLPPLFGDDSFTRITLRFAWHITTIAWFGFAALLYQAGVGQLSTSRVLITVGATFAVTAMIALVASRWKHLSWIVFGAIAILCFIAA